MIEIFLMYDLNLVVVVFYSLSDFGVWIAFDDFGMGYLSLSYLKCFLIDILKIDWLFVCNLLMDVDDVSIVSVVIGMGKGL